nr:hypothetical protein [Tanacetum cinerariifolium]
MNSLREVKSQFRYLTETLQDFGTMPIFKRTFSQDFDLLEQHITKEILSQTDCKTILTKLRTTFENAFNSEFKERDFVIQNTCFEKEDNNSKTASNKSVIESILDYATKDVHTIKYKMSKVKERCMAYFRSLHSHLQVLSKEDLKGTRFKRAFISLFGQDADTFTSIMLLNVDQLQKQLDKDEFQEDASMAVFWVVKHFKDTLLQHMGNVKKYVAERIRHQRRYDRRVNKRQMQTQESKIDTGKAVDDDLVVTESSETESEVQNDNSRSGNDTDTDDANIRPIYDEEPMAEVQLTTECNIFAIGQQHTEQPEIINEDTKFAKTSVLGKPVLQSLRNQSVVRQPNVFKFERPKMSKPMFASQVDVNNILSRPITQHYLPKRREYVFAKPDHMIASSESRNSSKNMLRFSSNDMVHNHYLDEARKKTQERGRNSKPSVMYFAKFQSTVDGSKPKP